MRRNDEYENGLFRMEKRASNKVGVFLVIVVALILLGGVFFYLYSNKDGIDWSFSWPWENGENKIDQSDNPDNIKLPNSNSSSNKEELSMPSLKEEVWDGMGDYKIIVSNLQADDHGFTLDIAFEAYRNDYTFVLEKILVDGFDTSVTLNKSVAKGAQFKENIRINKSDLNLVNVSNFSNLTFYYRVDTPSLSLTGSVIKKSVTVNSIVMSDNVIKGLVEIDNSNQTTVSYYTTVDDKDNYYIYFDFKNISLNKKQQVSIKKLLINGKIYDYKDFKTEIYQGAEKVVYLIIPKSEVKTIENFTVSFTMLCEVDGKITAVYITNEYSKKL